MATSTRRSSDAGDTASGLLAEYDAGILGCDERTVASAVEERIAVAEALNRGMYQVVTDTRRGANTVRDLDDWAPS